MWGKPSMFSFIGHRLAKAAQKGQVAVIFALGLTALLGIAALAIDGGNLYLSKRHLQSAADLSALAGAQYLTSLEAPDVKKSEAKKIAEDYAARNGYPSPQVQVYIPPRAGRYSSDMHYIEVVINRTTPTFFAGLLGVSNVDMSSRAIARAGKDTSPWAILALMDKRPGIGFAGGATVNIVGVTPDIVTGIMSNSAQSPSIDQNAAGNPPTINGVVSAVGTINGNYNAQGIYPGAAPYPDPLMDMPPPVFWIGKYGVNPDWPNCFAPNCDVPYARNNDPQHPNTLGLNGNDVPPVARDCVQGNSDAKRHTLCPGVYYGGLKINGGEYRMAPGIYVMAGGGFDMEGGKLTGDGILIYNTSDPEKPTGAGGCGALKFVTSGADNGFWLTASHDPQYWDESTGYGWGGNVVIFQDRACTGSSCSMQLAAGGGSTSTMFGVIYVPTNNISVSGGAIAGISQGQIIGGSVNVGGGGDTTVIYDPDWVAVPPGATLVE